MAAIAGVGVAAAAGAAERLRTPTIRLAPAGAAERFRIPGVGQIGQAVEGPTCRALTAPRETGDGVDDGLSERRRYVAPGRHDDAQPVSHEPRRTPAIEAHDRAAERGGFGDDPSGAVIEARQHDHPG